jgi:chromate transport protein ChrA
MGGIRGAIVAVVVFVLIAVVVDLALAILLASLAGLVELTLRNLREPIEA